MVENDITKKNNELDINRNSRNMDKAAIDKELIEWFKIITTNLEANTPTRVLAYILHPQESDLLKVLHQAYQQIKNYIVLTPDIRRQILFLQDELKKENVRLFEEKWNKLINKMELNRKDPKQFWEEMRRLMGGRYNSMPAYIFGDQRRKLTQNEEKLNQFKEVWEDIFCITEEDNQNFEMENERIVARFIEENRYRTNHTKGQT